MATIRKPKTALRFSKPASWWGALWREGLPSGNGRIGASVLGGAGNETIIINHSDLRWQGRAGTIPDIADKVSDARKKLEDANYRAAEKVLSDALIAKSYRPQLAYPLPLVDLKVTQPIVAPVKEYSRLLNMETGEVEVSFKEGSTKFERTLFVSRVNDFLVYEISRSGTKLVDATFSFELHDRNNIRTATAVSKLPESPVVKYENFFMYFAARSDNGTEFGAAARINYFGGSMEVSDTGITVKGADHILVTLKVFVESQKEKEWKVLKTELAANKLTYDKLLKEHVTKHAKLFGSAEFDLDAAGRERTVDELLAETVEEGSVPPALVEKLWYYARYLTVCGTNPEGRILTPVGLWCGDYKAEAAQTDASGSLQILYAHTLAGGLAELMLPIFAYYEEHLDELKKNAARIYGCRGIFVPSVVAPASGLIGSTDPAVIHFTGAAGWLGQLYYDYYLYTSDIKFLKTRALPFMREAAQFYELFFKVTTSGKYESAPSYSPENCPLNIMDGSYKLCIARNATIDFAIARELFTNLIKGSKATGLYADDIEKWLDMLTRIPAYTIAPDGCVREYMDARLTENHETRSLMQFYPLYPGTEAVEKEPELLKAYTATVKKRTAMGLKQQTAAGLGKLAAVYARLNDGEGALDTITALVRTVFMNNLVSAQNDWRGMGIGAGDFWAAYNLEGNMGIAAALQEMAVYSREGYIRLLPAIPSEWKKGEFEGLCTRAGAEVDIAWDYKKGVVAVKIKSRKAAKVEIQLPAGYKKVKGAGAEHLDPLTGIITIDLAAGKAYNFEAR